MLESALLLFLVIDPFGNLPFVLAVLSDTPAPRYWRIVVREILLAFSILVAFALAGDDILSYLGIERPALTVAGGVILFLISLKMVFRSAAEIFDESYRLDPFLVPIAVPSLAGPSAITTVMILRTQPHVELWTLLGALGLVLLFTCVVLLAGRRIRDHLGIRGIRALEKFMGMLLNLVSVNMILAGVRDYLFP